jgi:hypothetical protein
MLERQTLEYRVNNEAEGLVGPYPVDQKWDSVTEVLCASVSEKVGRRDIIVLFKKPVEL